MIVTARGLIVIVAFTAAFIAGIAGAVHHPVAARGAGQTRVWRAATCRAEPCGTLHVRPALSFARFGQ